MRVARGAVHLRRAAQRVGVLHPAVAVAVAGDDRPSRRAAGVRLRALTAWPTCGRSACRSAAKARSVPSSASTVIAAVTSASRSSAVEVGEREAQHPEHAVGAVDQRETLLGAQRRPARARRAASAAAAGDDVARRRSTTSPSPISASAQWASGARSPLAPSEPCSRTTGVMPALSSASCRSTSSGRAPE